MAGPYATVLAFRHSRLETKDSAICARKLGCPGSSRPDSAAPMLGACQAVAGADEDISADGRAVANSAENHAP
jgi:hypothetical protein